MKKLINRYWKIILLLFVIGLTYKQLPQQFFQQDEWHHLGQEYIWHQKGIINFFLQDAISPVGIRFLPLGYLLNYFQFSLFGSNPIGYSLVSLSLHLLNVFLIFLVIKKLINKERIAFLTALFFGVWASHQQAITWLIQHSTTLPALTFSLLAIYFFLESKIFPSFLSVVAAILFKETSYFIFPFLLFLPFILGEKVKNILRLKSTRIIFFTGLIYTVILMLFWRFQPRIQSEIFIPKAGFAQTLERRVFSIPLRSITQSIFQEKTIISLSRGVAALPVFKKAIPPLGTSQFDVYIEQALSKKLMYFMALVVITITLVILRNVWTNKRYLHFKKGILISLMFIVFGSFPLLFISTLAGSFTFLESRYLYIIDIGMVLLLALLADYLLIKIKYFGWVFIALTIILNTILISNILAKSVEEGNIRRDILAEIQAMKPNLPDKVIIYTESDKSYYGLPPEIRIMPFQSGFGETLMVYYQPTEKLPLEFFQNDFLWNIDSQGYKEFKNRGFGYYRDDKDLFEAIRGNQLSLENIIGFSFDSPSNQLVDISEEIKGRYLGYLASKVKIGSISKATASFNKNDIYLVFDNNRVTAWNSGVAYSIPQFIEIYLGQIRKITQIVIDSYLDKDQGNVGYKILLSNNKKDWQQVFYSKKYPAGNDGINKIYFRPQNARYLKIEQIGFHKFAPWVINELTIYETK